LSAKKEKKNHDGERDRRKTKPQRVFGGSRGWETPAKWAPRQGGGPPRERRSQHGRRQEGDGVQTDASQKRSTFAGRITAEETYIEQIKTTGGTTKPHTSGEKNQTSIWEKGNPKKRIRGWQKGGPSEGAKEGKHLPESTNYGPKKKTVPAAKNEKENEKTKQVRKK